MFRRESRIERGRCARASLRGEPASGRRLRPPRRVAGLIGDAYSVFPGGRHPDLLGSKVREGWPEVAAFNDDVMRVGLAGGTLSYRDQEPTLYRHGPPEQVWLDLDDLPLLDEVFRPAGVLCLLAGTTERIAGERELKAVFTQAGAGSRLVRPERALHRRQRDRLHPDPIEIPARHRAVPHFGKPVDVAGLAEALFG